MDELVERVRQALTAGYSGADDGRIRDVPDRRAIRWYTTIGLVDRPIGMRGRSALYGPRHLQQLVAIKRQQAAGHTLAQIQADLTWVSPEALAELSGVPSELLETPAPEPDDTARPARFWAHQPTAGAAPTGPVHRAAFHEPPPTTAPPIVAGPVHGVALSGGVILLVPHPLSESDRDDIAAAAAPLLDLLDARGLLDGSSA